MTISLLFSSFCFEEAREFEIMLESLEFETDNWFKFYEGTSPILVIAPHATPHWRGSRLKEADKGTGALAILLHHELKIHTLITTRITPNDANWTDDSEFKVMLSKILKKQKPKLVIDLHAAKSCRPFAVDCGTMHGNSLLGKEQIMADFRKAFTDHNLIPISENFFSAEKNQTITKWTAKHGIPAIQLEINSRLLISPTEIPTEFNSLVNALKSFICTTLMYQG